MCGDVDFSLGTLDNLVRLTIIGPVTLDDLIEAQDTFRLPSMRDRFAMAALPAVIAQRVGHAEHADLAREAYAIADAMVAAMGDGASETETP